MHKTQTIELWISKCFNMSIVHSLCSGSGSSDFTATSTKISTRQSGVMAEGAAFRSFKDTVRVFLFNLFQLQSKLIIQNCSLTNCISYMLFYNKCYTWHSIYGSVVFTNISTLDLLDTARAALTYRKHDGELLIFFSIQLSLFTLTHDSAI